MSDVMDDSMPSRQIYELQEQISELRQRLTEQVERERVLNLELLHARRDVDVKTAYISTLERQLSEAQVGTEQARAASEGHITWLQKQVDRHQNRADQAVARRRELRRELDAARAELGRPPRGRLARAARTRLERHPRALRVARAVRRRLG